MLKKVKNMLQLIYSKGWTEKKYVLPLFNWSVYEQKKERKNI